MKYSQERKQVVLAKLAPPHQRTVKDVPAEEGISPRPSITGASRHALMAACSRMMVPIPRAGRHGTSSLR